ncbi:CocE/NonD family hydrolase [Nocardia goodfellowii]|uniref:CocE/NonD family hydrolase n=1 Tax=Nocardia goodfellowii TaxID=882446 RepID=A0ABS4QJ13_9NOCA|nr:CocE/NonD family hydrolase [Nocardia goodfellowii]MBP2191578.1 putative CocE/NonD family hydrolase [Nocardia goodfellowii]
MSDGATLTADITRPGTDGEPVAEPLPAVVIFTPYNKMLSRLYFTMAALKTMGRLVDSVAPTAAEHPRLRFTPWDLFRTLAVGGLETMADYRGLARRGYATVVVDIRGTGSSTGAWEFHGEREQLDYLETLAWVREQPWCNGDLGLAGISYHAQVALIAAGLRPPGLKAAFIEEGSEDIAREIALAGGVPCPFVLGWILGVTAGKWIPSVTGLARSGLLGRYLRDRVAHPVSWLDRGLHLFASDDHPDSRLGPTWQARLARFEQIEVPTFLYSAWHDIYSRSSTRLYDRLQMPPGEKQVLVDQGYHLSPGSGLGAPGGPPTLADLQSAWFDKWLKGIDTNIDHYGPIVVRRQADGWVRLDEFPEPGSQVCRLYLESTSSGTASYAGYDGSLSVAAPTGVHTIPIPARLAFAPAASNTAVVTLGLSVLLGPDFGTDERPVEIAAVCFTGAPLPADTVLSGPLNLHFQAITTGIDAFWSITVSDVDPDGSAAVLTRGALRSSLRALDPAGCRYVDGQLVHAQHPMTADSALPVEPHVPHTLDIDIQSTDALIRAGHRLRVAVRHASFPLHMRTPSIQRKLGRQAIYLTGTEPSYLTFLAKPLTGSTTPLGGQRS